MTKCYCEEEILLIGTKAHCRFDIEHKHKLEACVDMVPWYPCWPGASDGLSVALHKAGDVLAFVRYNVVRPLLIGPCCSSTLNSPRMPPIYDIINSITLMPPRLLLRLCAFVMFH